MKSFFSFLSENKPEPQKSTPVVITSYSQPHVLQQRMKEQHLTHGQTVKANLSPVRLESNFGKMVMYFCPLQDIAITERITDGDGGSLPAEATIIDFNIPANTKPGLYTLENATVFSNGTMQVIANENTTFRPYGDPRIVSEVSISGHIPIGEMIDMYYRNKKEISDSMGIPASRF
jgi:hypothetical protein